MVVPYDYVIVGGGSAGCTMAARLGEVADARILLIEAGPPDDNPDIHRPVCFYKMTTGPLTWGYETAPSAQRDGHVMPLAQARVLGGGSSINAMVFTRGNPKDYDEWASDEGCNGWAFKDVLPYFRRAEDNNRLANDYHGTGGPLGASDQISPHRLSRAFVRAAQQAGLAYNPDFNGAVQEGSGLYQVTQRRARRCSAVVGYLRPAMKRGNIDLVTDALANRIIVENGRAIGVQYFANGQMREARAEQEVIVASGAIGSPKLLLLSGIGPADELNAVGVQPVHDLPGVGKNLQDHIDVYSIHELNGPHSYDKHTQPMKMLWAGLEYMLFNSGPVTSNLAEAGGFWYADQDERSPDIQFHFLPGAGVEAGVPPVPSGYGCTINSCHLRPRSRGSVTLNTADPADPPVIDPNYWAEEYDFEMSLRGLEKTRDIARQSELAKFITKEHMPGPRATARSDLEAYAKRFGKTDYHPVGTCKMGVDDMAVVDPQCRVRGIDGLRVADSSIMPRLISSNTNAASIMIGEKASDMIRGNRATEPPD
ncbi:MAG: GMC family oxidoreductase N-terminal domain-containing protein [Alphaproteobacteria bacterium]|nr:GMC family oxidoreductase N-terminal domain-containing protein [Alphaproteobacteria bacterium]